MLGSDPAHCREHGMGSAGIEDEMGFLLHLRQEGVQDIGGHPLHARAAVLGRDMHLAAGFPETFHDACRGKTFFVS